MSRPQINVHLIGPRPTINRRVLAIKGIMVELAAKMAPSSTVLSWMLGSSIVAAGALLTTTAVSLAKASLRQQAWAQGQVTALSEATRATPDGTPAHVFTVRIHRDDNGGSKEVNVDAPTYEKMHLGSEVGFVTPPFASYITNRRDEVHPVATSQAVFPVNGEAKPRRPRGP